MVEGKCPRLGESLVAMAWLRGYRGVERKTAWCGASPPPRRVALRFPRSVRVTAARQDDEAVVQQVRLGGRGGADPAPGAEELFQVGGDVVPGPRGEPDHLEQGARERRSEQRVDLRGLAGTDGRRRVVDGVQHHRAVRVTAEQGLT